MNEPTDIAVVAVIEAKHGQRETLLEILQELASLSQHDDGCTSYELYESKDDAGDFYTLETWASEAALHAHLSKHDDLLQRAKPVLAAEPKLTVLFPR